MPRAQHTDIPRVDLTYFPVHREVDLHPVLVPAHAPNPAIRCFFDRDDLRVRAADQVRQGDVILAVFQAPPAGRALARVDHDYSDGPYPADPRPYDPSCGCGVCGRDVPAGAVVVTAAGPCNTCDVHPADAPLLVLPYVGRAFTFSEAKNLARGGTSRIDTGRESFEQYLVSGNYKIIIEPPAT